MMSLNSASARASSAWLAPLSLQPRDSLLQAGEARLKLALLQIAVSVRIDQSGDALARLGDLFREPGGVGLHTGAARIVQAAHIFLRQPLRVLDQAPDLLPDGLFQAVGAHLRIVAYPLATETVGIGSNTTDIIGDSIYSTYAYL